MLCWCWLSGWGRECVAFVLTHKGSLYLISGISKYFFHPGGMCLSKWMHSVRALRDTPVAGYSTPGVNSMPRFVYWPSILVSLFLLALLVFYLKQTLWLGGRLWPDVGMGSLCTHFNQECNAMGDAVTISLSIPSTCIQNAILSLLNIHIIPSRQINVTIANTTFIPFVSGLSTRSYLWNYVHAANEVSHVEH